MLELLVQAHGTARAYSQWPELQGFFSLKKVGTWGNGEIDEIHIDFNNSITHDSQTYV